MHRVRSRLAAVPLAAILMFVSCVYSQSSSPPTAGHAPGTPRNTTANCPDARPSLRRPSPTPSKPVADAAPLPNITHIKSPAPITSIIPAKGGQYLALHLQKLNQLAIFDVKESKIIKYLPLTSNDIVIAGSASKIFIGVRDKRIIQRIDLAKLAVDLTVSAPDGGIADMAAGANADGPVILISEREAKKHWVLNPITLAASPAPSKHWNGQGGGAWGPVQAHVSFDGSAMICSGGGWAGIEIGTIRGLTVERIESGGFALDGATIAGNGNIVFPVGGEPLHADLTEKYKAVEGTPFPTESTQFSFALRKEKKEAVLVLLSHADLKPILTLRHFPELNGQSKLPLAQRVHLIPHLKSLVTLGENSEELLLRRFDLSEELEASGIDYLFVESVPNATASRGDAYSYQISVLSKRKGVTFELQSGPPGMTLSSDGKLTWNVPKDFGDAKPAVIISISDASGQSIFHTFNLNLGPPAAGLAIAAAAPASNGDGNTPAPASTREKNSPLAPATIADAKATAPSAENALTTIRLDEPFSEFHAANAGEALLFYQKKARAISVYETATGRLLGAIKLGADNVRFAAGLDTVVVAIPDQRILQSYSLKTLQRTKSAPLPDERPLKEMRMGTAGKGPVFLYFGGEMIALDANSLERLKLKGALPSGNPDWWFTYRVSADGSTIVSWDPYASPSNFSVTRIAGNAVSTVASTEGFSMANRRFTPTAHGSLILYELKFYNAQANKMAGEIRGYDNGVPTCDPRFFLAVKKSEKRSSAVAICTVNDRRILTEIPSVGDVGTDGFDAGRCGIVMDMPGVGEPRVIYLPQSNILAAVTISNDQFNICKVTRQLPGAAPGKGVSPGALAVISLPPSEVTLGAQYSYQIQLLPEKTTAKYKVESGPQGLAVSPAGLVTWKPDTRPIGGRAKVILSISDAAGNEIPHAFDIVVTRANAAAASGAAAATIVKADANRIELPSANYTYTPGFAGHALILSGDQLAITAADGFTIQSSHVLPREYTAIAERKDYFVALGKQPRSIDILHKKTFAPIRTRPIAFTVLNSLVLHPTLPISYISYTQPTESPSHHFVIFDETTAEARTDDNFIGNWLAIAPDGSFLVSGFGETYRKGSDIIDNPDRIWIVPTYGSIDTLACYDLGADGLPTRVNYKEDVGGNGVGIRLSPDGKRVTYLSHTGYPNGSQELAGWDPLDLKKLPVSYATKEVANCQELAFHPLLPLLASPGKGSVAFFNKDSGASEVDRIADVELAGESIGRVYFSPDGKNILAETTTGEIHYLYRVPLKLSPQEIEAVSKLPRPDKPLNPPVGPAKPPAKFEKLPAQRA